MTNIEVGKGVELSVEGDILTIKLNLRNNFGVSASGKSTTIATTNGNVDVPNHPGFKLGLNLYNPIKKVG